MPAKKAAKVNAGPAYKIRTTLLETNPPIWREFLVDANMRLDLFCGLLIYGFGWGGGHLHELATATDHYAAPDEFTDEGETLDASKYILRKVFPNKKSRAVFTYDFGDSWEHVVIILATDAPATGQLPCCIGGARACPPEDCGGIPGYENLCEAMKNKKHPEREELIEWLGEIYDPEAFSVTATNEQITSLKTCL